MFEPKADRDLRKLNQRFKKKVLLFIQEVKPFGVFITEAWRSEARQKYLIKKGLSKVNTSFHQLGLAVDVAFQDDTRTKQIERELYPKDFKRWREVADIAKKYGIVWGYDLWNWDKPHFEDDGLEYIDKNITMTEEETKATEAIISMNSALWSKLNDKGKEILAETNKELRTLLK